MSDFVAYEWGRGRMTDFNERHILSSETVHTQLVTINLLLGL